MNNIITKENIDSKLGKTWWVRIFRRNTLLRLDNIENQISQLVRSLGIIEPEPDEVELTIIEMIEELERRIAILENNSNL